MPANRRGSPTDGKDGGRGRIDPDADARADLQPLVGADAPAVRP
jgi:hypothetical protein